MYILTLLVHVLIFVISQSNEVGGSLKMEKEGFIRGMKTFEENDLRVKMLVTDRHVQLAKLVRENYSEIQHRYDIWHVAKSECCYSVYNHVQTFIPYKGFKKKVEKLGKKKDCEEVRGWIKSMVNHLYWCVMSSEDGDQQMVLEKWKSMGRHIHNQHSGHGSKYKRCAHRHLRARKWLKYRKFFFDKYKNNYNFVFESM